uniref:Nucleoporin p58/p45 n=1 Tax=Timema shepardi TaxID=629360 RepID=A0A7R9AP94_TIMSH|nr:unnamed protein product [Timema shepardi]
MFGNTGNTGSSFAFGSNKTPTGFGLNTASQGGGLFGASPSFGSTAAPNLSFGSPAPSQQPTGLSFGAPSGQTSGLSFGTPASAASSGLSFGAPSVSTGLTFGAPASTVSTGLSFGAPASTSLSFGAPASIASTGLSFGAPASTGLSFGAPASTASTTLSFGPALSTGLSFGTPASTGLTFGAPSTIASTVLPFGAPTSTGLSFGAPAATTSSGLSFGAPSVPTTSTGLFGAPTSTVSTGLTFGIGQTPGLFGAQASTVSTATSSTGLSGALFSAPATSSQPAFPGSTGLSFGAPASTETSFSLGALSTASTAPTNTTIAQGLGAKTLGSLSFGPTPATSGATTSAGLSLGGGSLFGIKTPATTAATSSVGLGGVDASQGKPGLGPKKQEIKAAKENLVPNEIIQTIDAFKSFVKSQKNLSSEISRGSAKPLLKVEEDTTALKNLLSSLGAELVKNKLQADKLKAEIAKCLQNAEMAQRTHETPTALQFQNTAPLQFFTELAAKFDKDMETLGMEIENAEKHINSLSHARAITPQGTVPSHCTTGLMRGLLFLKPKSPLLVTELTAAMRMLHDTFVALAGRLQTVHNAVEVQKERFLDLRRYLLKDNSDVFGSHTKPSVEKVRPPPGVTPGPSPFSALGSQSGYGLIFSTSLDSQNINSLGWSGVANPQPSFNLGGTLSGSGAFSPMKTPLITDTSSFQLQKPPLGNKRNKR